jgi:hypothetical protein
MLTPDQLAWTNKLDKLLKAMPDGIEIIVGAGSVAVMEAGFYERELSSSDVDMMTQGGDLISRSALREFTTDAGRVRPNSESI